MSTRNRFAAFTAVAMFAVLITATAYPLAADDSGDWINLLESDNLDGFKFYFGKSGTENDGTFKIKDGMLICSGRPSGYMYTEKSYSNTSSNLNSPLSAQTI